MKSVPGFTAAVLAFILALGVQVTRAQSGPPADLDAFVARLQKQYTVPGIGLAIVKDGKVVLARGYGIRTMGKTDRVDGKTLFGIASNTKAFTATALELLVEEGKIEWDAPVTRYLPWFALSDPYVTRELTVRDLLVHRSGLGLGGGDLLWWPPTTYDRKEIARRLRYVPLVTSFRSAYAYDNVLYTVAGELIETISGQTWEEYVAGRILKKVGMTGSTVRHSDAGEGVNVATPHAKVEGTVRVVKSFSSDNTNPAGGINSSAEDMAKWLIVQLDSGRVADGTRLYSPRFARQQWTVVTPRPTGNPAPELIALRANFNGYGLGFDLRDFRGKKLVSHTGGLPGYLSMVSMIPELKLGVVVLTNQESGDAFSAITFHILDHYLGAPPKDWLDAYRKVAARSDSNIAATARTTTASRDSMSHSSLPTAQYAGTYTDAWYGDVVITQENGGLVIRFSHTPSLVGDLVHWQYDTFLARWRDRELRADAFVTFALNPDGTIERAKMRAASPDVDFSFDFHDLLLKPKN